MYFRVNDFITHMQQVSHKFLAIVMNFYQF